MRLWVVVWLGACLTAARQNDVCLARDRAWLLLGLAGAPPPAAAVPSADDAAPGPPQGEREGRRAAHRAYQALVAAVLVALVLGSMLHACRLFSQESEASPFRTHVAQEMPSPRRRCSLVELTVSRHARRESLLRHASSLDNSSKPQRTTGAKPVPLLRRSSFPVHPAARQEAPGCTTPGKLSRRPSMDASEGDSSPDTSRKRVRIIRRH